LVKRVVDQWAWRVSDFIPPGVRARCHLLELPQAIAQAHYPDNELLKDRARERLAFDELFLLQLGVLARKRNWQEGQPGNPFKVEGQIVEKFLHSLLFTLTGAQQRVLREIMADLEKPKPMSRLLQGEVGSGKTVVAAAALLAAVGSGYQGALMAPTEILAEQHFSSLCQLLSGGEGEGYLRRCLGILPRPINVSLLIGGLPPKEKQVLQSQIREGEADIVVGTHALIQKGVEFRRLGLAVVDEQHRFGVLQRSELRQKGFNPHVLVMTATPIPRTLALTLYGDLDLSVIDELPPGRQWIKTKWLSPGQRERAYSFLRREIRAGRQAFIICPLIEESENIVAKAAIAEHRRLSEEVFPELRLGLLHGRMLALEKEEVMRHFRAGELDILVSTSVVEVGIDVPNATVMLVEGADRFGLSQLHQFRGRVGRGKEQSYCLLLAELPSEEGKERLALIERIQDGFDLAEEDLRLRGPGEFFGTRQSGLPDLRMARISDVALLERAREEAIELFHDDPGLEVAEHRLLSQEMARVWGDGGEWS
jgi:ATP-dependent DNA helicase RecG